MAPEFSLNPNLAAFACIRCGDELPVADHFEGCPGCARHGHAASVRPVYRRFPDAVAAADRAGCGRYAGWLAYAGWPSLGEGGTPLIAVPSIAEGLGLRRLWIKNEGQNPTGSHKDRMSMLVAARARQVGAGTVVAASSGNAGVSIAAYAAAAGLRCVVVTTTQMNPNWRRAVQMMGAELVATETASARWTFVAEMVRRHKWYPVTNFLTPPVGSNPFGVDGYRTIAFELYESLAAEQPDAVVVPTSRADLLWGIARGYADLIAAGFLRKSPRIHAVEPFPRISRVLDGEDYRLDFFGMSKMVSLGGWTVTAQALDALRLGGGTAVAVAESEVIADQKSLARAGVYLELSSAAALTGLRQLVKQGAVGEEETAVLIGTSHGFKEFETFDDPIPVAAP